MGDFVEEAFAEITEQDRQRILSDNKVIEALKSKSPSIGSIVLGTVEVKFRLSINKKLRRKMALYRNKIQDSSPSPEDAERVMYELLASLSIEEPWNSVQTWVVYDDNAEDNGAQEVLFNMLKQITSHVEDVKNFRRIK